MNEDETTQALSDKVLDRANVLRFGKPEKPKNLTEIPEEESGGVTGGKNYIPHKKWLEWIKIYDNKFDKFDEIEEKINNLNNALNIIGRPFGFRVHNAIGTYIANYPKIAIEEHYRFAVADQIEQKIIPKLSGIDMDEKSNECLEIIGKAIKETNDSALDEAFDKSKEDSIRLGMFKWHGVSRIG